WNTNPHAFGVDNTACSFHTHKNTPSAWMIALDLAPVLSAVLRLGPSRRARLVYSCQAPKHYGKLTLKIYTKGECVQRIEAIIHNTREWPHSRPLKSFPWVVERKHGMVDRSSPPSGL